MTQSRPFGSIVKAIGWTTSGSAAHSVTVNPGGTVMRPGAWAAATGASAGRLAGASACDPRTAMEIHTNMIPKTTWAERGPLRTIIVFGSGAQVESCAFENTIRRFGHQPEDRTRVALISNIWRRTVRPPGYNVALGEIGTSIGSVACRSLMNRPSRN